jgi:hypothetical protein
MWALLKLIGKDAVGPGQRLLSADSGLVGSVR